MEKEEVRAVLGNVEEMRRDYPGFEAPPMEYRESLRPGDLAELMFLSERSGPESHWAEVEDVLGPGWYRGVLDSGDPIEFGPEHVSDIKATQPQMGASIFDYFGSGQVPEKKPSIWEWEDRALWVEAQRGKERRERAERGEPPKRTFWEWLTRKPKPEVGPEAEVEPIPPEERRERFLPAGYLPPGEPRRAPPEIVMPPEAPEPEEPEEFEEPEVPEIIVPEEPVREILLPEGPEVVHEEPIRYGELLRPTGGLIAPETPSIVPGAIILPSTPQPTKPEGMIVPEPEQVQRAFQVIEPKEPTKQFAVIEEVPSSMALVEETKPFSVIVPPHPPEVKPFDVLEVPQPGTLVVRPSDEVTVFSEITPAQELSPFMEPVGEPRELVIPTEEAASQPWTEPVVPAHEEVEKPKKKKKKKKKKWMSIESSASEWEDWIYENFNVDELWEGLRGGASDPWFQEMRISEHSTGLPATIPIETYRHDAYEKILEYLNIRPEEYRSLLDEAYRLEKELDYTDAWEKFETEIIHPLNAQLEAGFSHIQPKDLPGNILLEYDGNSQKKDYGLVYYDPLPEEELEEFQREREIENKEEKALIKKRNKKIEKILGSWPTVDELIPWARETYTKDFWRWLKEQRKSRGFQKEVQDAYENEGGPGTLEAVEIAEEGPDLYGQLSNYFGIPMEIFSVYFESAPLEEATDDLWNQFLRPFFKLLDEAMDAIKPKGIPGMFEFDWDESDQIFVLKYLELAREA